ncbi:MAG TPA: hypothetical protein VJN94_02185 [Candidatus Binataceae bacterium]|nr:hypothetical protein [Candidatus Binataceae bacterium]
MPEPADTHAVANKAATPPAPKPRDAFDPFGWEVPAVCKDCGKDFKVPYRHFQAGVVFHCPHCHGSYVPKTSMYRQVRDAFETFYARMKRERDELISAGGDEAAFHRRFESEKAQFHQTLERMAHAMRPAGKVVRPKWFRSMFT